MIVSFVKRKERKRLIRFSQRAIKSGGNVFACRRERNFMNTVRSTAFLNGKEANVNLKHDYILYDYLNW